MSDAESRKDSPMAVETFLRVVDALDKRIEVPQEELSALLDSLPHSMPLRDAVRLRHELDKRVTYRGLNAVQVEALRKLTKEDWVPISKEYDDWRRAMASVSARIGHRVMLVAAGALLYALLQSWFHIARTAEEAAVWAVVLFLGLLGMSLAGTHHRDGYMEGFRTGLAHGVNRALGISQTEIETVDKRASQMEMDARLFGKEGQL